MSLWRIVSLIGSLTGARLAGAGLGFAVQIVLARLLPPAAVGTVMLGMSLSAFFGLAVTGGYRPNRNPATDGTHPNDRAS